MQNKKKEKCLRLPYCKKLERSDKYINYYPTKITLHLLQGFKDFLVATKNNKKERWNFKVI